MVRVVGMNPIVNTMMMRTMKMKKNRESRRDIMSASEARVSLLFALAAQSASLSTRFFTDLISESTKYVVYKQFNNTPTPNLEQAFMSVPDLESIKFEVLNRTDKYEIRQLQPYFVAEVTMPSSKGFDFYGASLSFNVLADYLFGKNIANEKMEMTTPVITRKSTSKGQKIDMTTPVTTSRVRISDAQDKWEMSFVMPSKYGAGLPLPKDPSVRIKEVSKKTVAVAVFSGYVTDEEVNQRESMLRNALQNDTEYQVKVGAQVEVAQVPYAAMGFSSSSVTLVVIIGTCFLVSNVVASGKVKFNYLEAEEWGAKDPSFAACSSGERQSPVDINTYEVAINKTLEPLERDYRVTNATLSTEGLQIEVFFVGSKGGLKIDGKTYKLVQFHLHTPSEHLLNGVQYAAELHQVHIAEDGKRAVVGVLFKHGPPSPLINMMMPQLQELAKNPCGRHQTSSIIPKFKSSYLRKWPRNYYRYHGSLSTPPCNENVIWSVLTEAKTISREQVDALKAPLCQENKNNARPTQPLNGRKVQKYDKN